MTESLASASGSALTLDAKKSQKDEGPDSPSMARSPSPRTTLLKRNAVIQEYAPETMENEEDTKEMAVPIHEVSPEQRDHLARKAEKYAELCSLRAASHASASPNRVRADSNSGNCTETNVVGHRYDQTLRLHHLGDESQDTNVESQDEREDTQYDTLKRPPEAKAELDPRDSGKDEGTHAIVEDDEEFSELDRSYGLIFDWLQGAPHLKPGNERAQRQPAQIARAPSREQFERFAENITHQHLTVSLPLDSRKIKTQSSASIRYSEEHWLEVAKHRRQRRIAQELLCSDVSSDDDDHVFAAKKSLTKRIDRAMSREQEKPVKLDIRSRLQAMTKDIFA